MQEEELITADQEEAPRFAPPYRIIATFFSCLLHPMFVPVYGALFLVYTHPFHFAGFLTGGKELRIFGTIAVNTILLPIVTVLMLKKLDFIKSIYMHTQHDRVIPYMATMIFYFWVFYVFRHQSDIPLMLTIFFLGNFIAIILAFMGNIFMKISMHMLGMGGLLGLVCTLLNDPFFNPSVALIIAVLLCGIVATSRLILEAHTFRELYWGLMIGIFSQVVAFWII